MPTKQIDAAHPLVLIGDDCAVTRALVSGIVVRHGFRCLLAANGRTVLALTRNHRPDVIILDINMPEMDGLRVLKSVREVESTRHIPVLLLSASADPNAVMEGLRLGANDYLVKPFNATELVARLEHALRRA